MDPPSLPTHSFFKPKTQPSQQQPSASASTASSSSSLPAPLPSTSSAPSSVPAPPPPPPAAKKRKTKAPAVDPKQGKLSFASGSGLGVVAAAAAPTEEEELVKKPKGKGKAKATIVDDEEEERKEMELKKQPPPPPTKKPKKSAKKKDEGGGGSSIQREEGANEVDVKDPNPIAIVPPPPAASSSKPTSTSSSSLPLPLPPVDLPIASTSTTTTATKKRTVKPNFLSKPQKSKPSSSKLASEPSSASASSSRPPPASPSHHHLQPPSPSKSQTESVDLTQDDSDEGPSPSRNASPLLSSVPAKRSRLRTTSTRTTSAQQQPVSIISCDADDEVQEVAPAPKPTTTKTRKKKGRIQEVEEIDDPSEGWSMDFDEEEEQNASSSKGKGKEKERDLSFFEPRKTRKKGGSAHAPIDLEEDVAVEQQQPAAASARRKKSVAGGSRRSPSIINLESPVKAKKPIVVAPPKEVHSFFAKRKAVVREGGAVGGAGGGAAMKQQEPMGARWPTREETHVGYSFGGAAGEGSSSVTSSSLVRRSIAGKGKGREMNLDDDASPSFFTNFPPHPSTAPSTSQRLLTLLGPIAPNLYSSLPSSSSSTSQPSLPPHLLSNPAFSRLLSSQPNSRPHPPLPPSKNHLDKLWSDKYKPRLASEVLHNSTEAVYLKEWLVALQVQGKAKDEKDEHEHALAKAKGNGKGKGKASTVVPAKRKIVRAVVKEDPKLKKHKRRKGDKSGYGEEDWIVNSDEEEEEDPIFSDFEEFEDEEDGKEEKDEAAQRNQQNLNLDASTSSSSSHPHPHPPLTPNRSTTSPSYPSLSTLLTNSILLVGPPGSGKTSSVYACAAELGWEVFEVYPGVGRRSGLALASLVGDMSKNHIVGKGGTGGGSSVGASRTGGGFFGGNGVASGSGSGSGKATNAFALMMKGKGGGGGSSSSKKAGGRGGGGGSVHDAISLDADEDDGSHRHNNSRPFPSTSDTIFASPRGSTRDPSPVKGEVVGSQPSKVRQSLILLEEVDVLFNEEDKGFWQGLIALISESKRPIVMTCNDLSTIPLLDLALQTILEYQPPPSSLAVPYLHLLAQAQGFSPSLESIETLYTRTAVYRAPGSGLEDGVGHPAPSQEREGSDLRRAIAALQIGCCEERKKEGESGEGAVGDVLDGLEREGGHGEVGLGNWATGGRKKKTGEAMEVNQQHQQQQQSSSSNNSNPPSASTSSTTLESISTLLDNISFINSHIDIRTSTLLELEEIDRYDPSPDDEVGYDLLRKWKGDPVDGSPVLAGTGWEREMAIEAGVLARELFDEEVEQGGIGSGKEGEKAWSLKEMQEKRSHHLLSLLTYLSPLIEPPTPLLPHPSLLLAHAPFIRHLVAQDDAFVLEEAQGLRAAEEGGRTIRPSARAAMIALAIGRTGGEMAGGGSSRLYGYQRWVVGLEEAELREVRGSGLGVGW